MTVVWHSLQPYLQQPPEGPMSAHLMNTYKRLPVAFVRGEGAWLWDESGKRYLDALAGIAVNGLGHAHPKLVATIADQAAKVIHTSNIYRVIEQEKLGEKLAQVLLRLDPLIADEFADGVAPRLRLVDILLHFSSHSFLLGLILVQSRMSVPTPRSVNNSAITLCGVLPSMR